MSTYKYQLGVVSVSFREHTPLEIVKIMKECELSFIEWGSDVHAPPCDTKALESIVSLQKEYGIKCSSYGTYFRLGETPIEELSDYILAAKTLGTDILRLWCGNKCGNNMTAEERDTLLSECKRAASIAEENNVTLCMECHRWSFTEEYNDAVWLMEEVSSPNFRMYWQPPHWKSYDESLRSARRISPYAVNVHVFNLEMRDGKPFAKPLAEAVNEWRSYLRFFPAPRTLLLEFMPTGTLAELSTEADALRQIVT